MNLKWKFPNVMLVHSIDENALYDYVHDQIYVYNFSNRYLLFVCFTQTHIGSVSVQTVYAGIQRKVVRSDHMVL
jgi:hypothetical protein